MNLVIMSYIEMRVMFLKMRYSLDLMKKIFPNIKQTILQQNC